MASALMMSVPRRKAAVYKNGHSTADYLDDLRQDLDCRGRYLRHVRYGSKQ